jgi:hypothetical protein
MMELDMNVGTESMDIQFLTKEVNCHQGRSL